MTTAKQLYDLQELDLALSEYQSRLLSIDTELADKSKVAALGAEIESLNSSLGELQAGREELEPPHRKIQEQIQEEEAKLYGGSITNIRELEAIGNETAALKEQFQVLDEQLLASMELMEASQERVRTLKEELARAKKQRQSAHSKLTGEKTRLTDMVKDVETQRIGMAANIQATDLRRYETLRLSKGGLAIAKVERGLCRGCLMALPTHQLQRARTGRETVLCSTCGRILFAS